MKNSAVLCVCFFVLFTAAVFAQNDDSNAAAGTKKTNNSKQIKKKTGKAAKQKPAENFNAGCGLGPIITSITLSKTEVIADCPPALSESKSKDSCPDNNQSIEVASVGIDPYDDKFAYMVTGGKITGTGANVIWDLSGVKPGTYQIFVSLDDGSNLASVTRSQSIRVVRCPDCK